MNTKARLWKIGIGLTLLLCGMQCLFGGGSKNGPDQFTIRSEAASIYMLKTYYYYDTATETYVEAPEETEKVYARVYETVPVTFETREGYEFKKMVINKVLELENDQVSCIMKNITLVDLYFYPVIQYEQTYQYYMYEPSTGKNIPIKTEVELAQRGDTYTTSMSNTEKTNHIQMVYQNGELLSECENFSYEVKGENRFDVYLYPNRTFLRYYNDQADLFAVQAFFYGTAQKLLPNRLTKTGYRFAGWKALIAGSYWTLQDQEEFLTPYTGDYAMVNLKPTWEKIVEQLTVAYHTGGEEDAPELSSVYSLEDRISLWKQSDILRQPEEASLRGWSFSPGQQKEYDPGGELDAETLYSRAKELGLVEEDEPRPVIHLYPVWDKAPVIWTTHLYVTQKDALAGVVTQEFLFSKIRADDPEEGRLKMWAGDDSDLSGVRFTDYQAQTFLSGRTGTVALTIQARDQAGNVSTKQMLCTIVESNGTYLGKTRRVRFISKDYLDTLDEDSVWNQLEQYKILLEETLEKAGCL